ncbi:hypothetical protein ACWCQW_28800 [Streptomyces mirabilis]
MPFEERRGGRAQFVDLLAVDLLDEGLSGLCVLVTGGSRGSGTAAARRFAAAGAKALTASRGAPPEDLPATFIPADLATEQGVAELCLTWTGLCPPIPRDT